MSARRAFARRSSALHGQTDFHWAAVVLLAMVEAMPSEQPREWRMYCVQAGDSLYSWINT